MLKAKKQSFKQLFDGFLKDFIPIIPVAIIQNASTMLVKKSGKKEMPIKTTPSIILQSIINTPMKI